MRIISQDGCFDMPYEQVMLQIYKNKIYVLNENFGGVEKPLSDPVIGEYSTEEKAIKVMKMLFDVHRKYTAITTMMNGIGSILFDSAIIKQADDFVSYIEKIKKYEYFQFPQDSEV